jgi:hypothetical protein
MKKFLGKVLKTAVPVVLAVASPESIVNVMGGMVLKHKVHSKIVNNQNIPKINLAVSVVAMYLHGAVTTGDWVAPIIPAVKKGAELTGMSWGMHQGMKIAAQSWISGPSSIGPGEKISL